MVKRFITKVQRIKLRDGMQVQVYSRNDRGTPFIVVGEKVFSEGLTKEEFKRNVAAATLRLLAQDQSP